MGKFKVGDYIIANASATPRYNITIEGWRGIVREVEEGGWMKVSAGTDNPTFLVQEQHFDLAPGHDAAEERIVVYTESDGKTVTAVHVRGGKVLSSAQAKCSPEDTFDFKIGAELAMKRLPKPFPKDKLVTGVFGKRGDGVLFVVVGDKLVYKNGGWDSVNSFDDNGVSLFERIDVLIEANSFAHADSLMRAGENIIWKRG